MWESECFVIPVIIGGLGCLSEKFTDYINQIPAEISADLCQKITMLGSEKNYEVMPIKMITLTYLYLCWVV